MFGSKETEYLIDGPEGIIQLRTAAGQNGPLADQNLVVIVSHPHPLHGGTMNNKVVTTLWRAYRSLGVSVVRYNYRGVEQSEGGYAEGIGEQDDLLAVHQWLRSFDSGFRLLLAGFSFGAGVAGQCSYKLSHTEHLLLVAPSVERHPPHSDDPFPCPVTVVQGEQDEVVSAEDVYSWVEQVKPAPKLLRFADTGHFFHGELINLRERVIEELTDWADT